MENSSSDDATPSSSLILRISGFASYGFAICVVVMGLEVVMRYIFNSPQIWVQDVVVMLVGSCFAIGGIVVLYEGAHIRIRVIYDSVSERLRRWLDLLSATVACAYLSLISYGAWVNASHSIRLQETTGTSWDSPLPMVLKTVLLVSAMMMAIIAVSHIIRVIKRLM